MSRAPCTVRRLLAPEEAELPGYALLPRGGPCKTTLFYRDLGIPD